MERSKVDSNRGEKTTSTRKGEGAGTPDLENEHIRRGYVVAIDAFHISDGLNVGELFARLWAAKILLIVLGLVGGVAGYAVSYLVAPRFESSATVTWAGADQTTSVGGLGSQIGALAAVSGILGTGESAKQEAVAVLHSDSFSREFILANDLIPVLFADYWDAANNRWRESVAADPPSVMDATEFFKSDVFSVSEDYRAGTILVSVTWTEPALAAQWANQLVALANERIRMQRISIAEASLGFLEDSLKTQTNSQLRNTIYQMMETQLNSIMIAEVKKDFAFHVIDPAMQSDADRFDFPNRLLFAIAGSMLGGQ